LICYFSLWKGIKMSGKVRATNIRNIEFFYIQFSGCLVHRHFSLRRPGLSADSRNHIARSVIISDFKMLLIFKKIPGSEKGIEYYLNPDLERLKDPYVWQDAATQVSDEMGRSGILRNVNLIGLSGLFLAWTRLRRFDGHRHFH